MKTTSACVAALLGLALFAGCGTHTVAIDGTFTVLKGDDGFNYSIEYGNPVWVGSCLLPEGYSDISIGTSVTVSNAKGTVVGTGFLKQPRETKAGCTFNFSVNDVPGDTEFYQIEVGHRGTVTYTPQQVRAPIALTLGG